MLSVKLKIAMRETSEGGAEGRSQRRRKCTKIQGEQVRQALEM